MTWVTEDGRHEGYAAHITTGGRVAVATSYDGLHMETGHYEDGTWTPGEVLPWVLLLGWEARCTCGWVGPLWRRPSGADMQDAAELALVDAETWIQSPFDATHITAEDAIREVWEQHVTAAAARAGREPRWV